MQSNNPMIVVDEVEVAVEGVDDEVTVPVDDCHLKIPEANPDLSALVPVSKSEMSEMSRLRISAIPSHKPGTIGFHVTAPNGVSYDFFGKPCKKSSHGIPSITEEKVELHPFDMLKVTTENEPPYQVDNFIGSCPNMKGAVLVTRDWSSPVFYHDLCTLKVTNEDEKGAKTVLLTAKANHNGNCDYGAVQDEYKLEMILKKSEEGHIICTSIKGISGKLAIPAMLNVSLKAFSLVTRGAAWDEVKSYNTGTVEQHLPITFTSKGEGIFEFKIEIDPQLLQLSGASYYMLKVLNASKLACPAVLNGSINLKPKKQLAEVKDKAPSAALSKAAASVPAPSLEITEESEDDLLPPLMPPIGIRNRSRSRRSGGDY